MKIVNKKNGINVKKLFRRYLIVPLLSLAFLFTVVTHAVAENTNNSSPTLVCEFVPAPTAAPSTSGNKVPESTTVKNATIKFINAEQTGLLIEQCSPDKSKPYPVKFSVDSKDKELKGALEKFSSGDIVNLDYNESKNNESKNLQNISVVISTVNESTRWITIIVAFGALFLLTVLILWWITRNILTIGELFVGQDKRLSNSKSQMAVWFFVLIASYISLTWLRAQNGGLGFVGGIGIPQNLLLLSGVSALTYAGAKAITQSQVNSKPGSKPEANEGKASPANFVTDDQGNTDFGDFQMTVITLLAVGVYLVQIFNFLGSIELHKSITLPDVDTTILSFFGLSQGAYLTKKAAVAGAAQEPEPLKKDMKGEEVKKIKTILNTKLGKTLTTPLNDKDDTFDQATEDAVKLFQKQKGLGETGIVDSKTREKLAEKE